MGVPWGVGVEKTQGEAGALNTVTSLSCCTGRVLVLTLTPGLGRGCAAPGLGWRPSSLPTSL